MKKDLTIVIKLGMAFAVHGQKKSMLTVHRYLVHCRRNDARAAAINIVHHRRDGS